MTSTDVMSPATARTQPKDIMGSPTKSDQPVLDATDNSADLKIMGPPASSEA